jgi:hypothetical protein
MSGRTDAVGGERPFAKSAKTWDSFAEAVIDKTLNRRL